MATGGAGSSQKNVKIRFYHGGTFEGNPKSSYLNGKVELMEHYDVEEICYWSLLSMVHQLDYAFNEVKRLYFLEPGKTVEDGLKLLFDDNSVLELSNHLNKFGEISIYVDHIGDGNEKSSDIPLPIAFFKPVDKSFDEDGKKGINENVEDDLNIDGINWSSDEGDDELTLTQLKDLNRFGTEDVGSYVTTSDGLDAEDAQRVPSGGLSYNPGVGDQGFFLGQIFRDAAQFKMALNDHSLKNQFSYCYKKTEKVRVRAKCATNGCQWEILASQHGNDNSFRVKTYFSQHSCLPTTHKKRVTSNVMPQKGWGRKGLEGTKKVKMSRVGRIMKCSICHKEGHIRTKCPMMPDAQSSNYVNLKNVSNKRKASTSTAPATTSTNDDQSSSERMVKVKKARPQSASGLNARKKTENG
ncbi:Terminal uridylyltransferase 7 [Gossypium arboreum]|uniref:Terminal uridylyltransferase 7 n=1 Tax=Gossypium arboreum TaxID=29729 RepID=A0A0B0PQ71_GOSAR|nr:Terminal uridylyltransferase 7 [Gossypium arboreum]